ncbi:MAG: hypothetical protein MJ225_02445 [Bacilli bacterium]|nr:hypothetical protein [Bacilli bacterium]
MNIFEISKEILNKVVVKEVPFALALRNAFKANNIVEKDIRSNITSLVGCELRHHLVFDSLLQRFIGEIEFEKTVYLRFYLANHLFLKRFLDKEILQLAKTDLDNDKIDEIIEFVSNSNELIPTEFDKDSPEFLSMRFNTPSWVIKMWQKQYGKGVVYKMLKANYHQSVPTVRIDEHKLNVNDFLSSHSDFISSPIENVLMFRGKGTPKTLEEFKDNSIFFFRPATKYIIDNLEVEPIKNIAIYSAVPNNIYLDLCARLGKDINLDIVTSHTQTYFDTLHTIENNHLNGVAVYNAKETSLVTCISSPVSLFFCLPLSTSLDLLRSTPDFFLRVKQERLDEMIANEKLALEECASLIEEGGKLVYMIPTLSKKESINVIGEFLANHPEFELKDDHQYFPFEELDSCLYYAILNKKVGI